MRQLLYTIVFLIGILNNAGAQTKSKSISPPDTTFLSYPKDLKLYIPQKIAYHQTFAYKLFMAQAFFDGKYKRKDNDKQQVFLDCEQAAEVIRKIDNLTVGMPKVVYLVGWQYNGHDSKYPAWFEGNEGIKRSGDSSALQSIHWLMQQALQYNTIVSLHINMFDAYEDSPLWKEYVANDIIARNTDGSLRSAEWGYPVSYAQEWKTGYSQKRIDSLCKMFPLQQAGTIHIDAFHTWPPMPAVDSSGKTRLDFTKGPISPYLKFSVQDETEAQKKIFRYWASKGIDVTSEGVNFLRESSFEGYQHMAWWFSGLDNYLKWPAAYYCGGRDNTEWGRLFGSSIHGEDIVKKEPLSLAGFKEQFMLNTAVWHYLNRLERKYILNHPDYKAVQFSDNVRTWLAKDSFLLKADDAVLVENNNVLIPADWITKPAFLAYSKKGYVNKSWMLPKKYRNIQSVLVYRISNEGKQLVGKQKVRGGKLMLSVGKDELLMIEKK